MIESHIVCVSENNGCQSTPATTTVAEFWLHSGLRITDADASQKEIQGTDWERVIGQGVNLAVLSPFNSFENLSNCNWNVPNTDAADAVGSYASYGGSTPPTAVPSPSAVPPLTNVLGVKFYWTQPFSKTQLNVTCTVQSSGYGDGGPVPPTQLSAFVNPYVVAPAHSATATFGNISLSLYGVGSTGYTISFGTQLGMPQSLGIQSTYSITTPTDFGGKFGANQVINYEATVVPVPSPTPRNTGGLWELDGCAIYTMYYDGSNIAGPAAVPTVAPNTTKTFSTVDAPTSVTLYSLAQTQREKDDFITTLMFRPTIGPNGSAITDSIWVPLEAYTWGFDGTAIIADPPTWAANPAPTQYPASGTYTTTANPSVFASPGNFPTWNGVVHTESCSSP